MAANIITPAEYEIRVYAPEAAAAPYYVLRGVIAPGEFLWSFRYRVVTNRVGSFTGTLRADSRVADWLETNALVEVRRRAPGAASYRTEETYILKYLDVEKSADAWKLAVGGPSLTWLAESRNIQPTGAEADGIYRQEAATAEQVMKALVGEQLGPSAPAETRVPSVVIDAPMGAGAPASVSGRYSESVLELLQQASDQGAIDFWFELEAPDAVRFKAGNFGTDRTVTTNPAGPFVVFSEARGNMREIKRMEDERQAWRIVDVLGAGKGADQEVATIPAAVTALHPFSRYRRAVNASQVEAGDTTGLNTAGNNALADNRVVDDLEFAARQTPTCRYGVQYFAGDRVTAKYEGAQRDYLIRAVEVFLSGQGETISVEFEA